MAKLGKPVRIARKGNPLFPLPPDYAQLDGDGQRLARVNALLQHRVDWGGSTYQDQLHRQGLVYTDVLNFFDRYFLYPDEEADFDPLFYDQLVDPAPIHYKIAYEGFVHRALIQLLPRGLAKSTWIRKEIVLDLLTRPGFSVVYTTAELGQAGDSAERIRMQFLDNERIRNDFGVLVPKKGQGSFSNSALRLINGSKGVFRSIGSKQRGLRPMKYILDDAEDDKKKSTNMEEVREHLDSTIKTVIMPMLQRAGTRFRFVGTPISNAHLITRLCADELGLSTDPELQEHPSRDWTRIVHEIVGTDGRSVWPSMYPTDAAERTSLGLHPEAQTLEDIERNVGEAAWWSEYRLKPGRGRANFFTIHKDYNEWWIEGDEPDDACNPLKVEALVCWQDQKTDEVHKRPLREVVASGSVFMTQDTSYGSGPTSDYKVWHVLVRLPNGAFLSLDMAAYRCKEPLFIKESLEAASRWRCHTVFPEYVISQRDFCRNMENAVAERLTSQWGLSHVPRVRKLPVSDSKIARITALGNWMDTGLIKLPRHRLYSDNRTDPYKALRSQIENFNPEARDGGLANDDHLDTLAAALLTPKFSAAFDDPDPELDPHSQIVEAYCAGETEFNGHRIVEVLSFTELLPYMAAHEEAREAAKPRHGGYHGTFG